MSAVSARYMVWYSIVYRTVAESLESRADTLKVKATREVLRWNALHTIEMLTIILPVLQSPWDAQCS